MKRRDERIEKKEQRPLKRKGYREKESREADGKRGEKREKEES